MNQLRVHHILCASNYEGNGYSNAFCKNMSAVTDHLRSEPDEELQLVAHPDMICKRCPNRTAQNTCSHNHNRVVEKDRRIAARLGLKEDAVYTWRELCRQTRAVMSEPLFDELCGKCSWKEQGLCRYEDFMARLAACAEG